MSDYLLPCPCGATATITTSQAGQQIECSECQQPLSIPTFREIKSLATVTDQAPRKPEKRWSELQGVIFAVSALTCFIALANAAYFTYQRLQLDIHSTREAELKVMHKAIDQMDYNGVGVSWDMYKQSGLREIPFEYVEARRVAAKLSNNTRVCVGILAAGIVVCIVSLFCSPQRRHRKKAVAAPK